MISYCDFIENIAI